MIKDFTKGSIPKLMISFLIPILLSNLLQAAYMLIDAFWAGRLLGSEGVAVIATGMPVVFLLSSLIGGIIFGASIMAGHAFGSRNRDSLTDIISTSAIGTTAMALFISVAGVIFCKPILLAINTPGPIFHETRVFLSIIISATVFASLGQWFAAMMTAAGDSKTPFFILVVSLVINAVLAPLLISGLWIFPKMGIAGSAVSTAAANISAAGFGLFVWRGHHLAEIAPFRLKTHMNTFKRIIEIGFPLALQMMVVSGSFLFILSLVNKFGTGLTAAFGIGSRIDHIAIFAIFAVTATISAMTAQNVGAGNFERIPGIMKTGMLLSLGFVVIYMAAVLIFPYQVAGIFTSDPSVIAKTAHYFRTVSFGYIAMAILFTYQGVMRGAGDTLASFLMIAFSMIIFRVPVCYYLSHTHLQETGIWLGMALSSFVGMVMFYFYYISGRWKEQGEKIAASHKDDGTIPEGMAFTE